METIINISIGKFIRDKIKKDYENKQRMAREFHREFRDTANHHIVQKMKEFNHHSHTSCYTHSVHVAYYNYLICKKLGWDYKSAGRGGLLHDLFLYDWHVRKVPKGERLHGFEHPTAALKNAGMHFLLNKKEGDIIARHMFPLTFTPPKYKETVVIILTDKFCSVCEVLDRFFKKKK